MAEPDCVSEGASSVCDEDRVRKLFQACDANGDGYIDSQDLLTICRELSLEDSLDELMLQLGADSQGRISYEQFLQRRLALRPEIDALKANNRDNASEHSQGKLDKWEWDSGARDMSPVPKNLTSGEVTKERLQQQLEDQAQRYEEQLTELHSVIAELTRKLHQQKAMAIAEEDEISESCASAHEDSVTCPLEVSELEPLENDLSDIDNKLQICDSPQELPEPSPNQENNELFYSSTTNSPDINVDHLKSEIANLKMQLHNANSRLMQYTNGGAEKQLESPESHLELDCSVDGTREKVRYGNIVPVHRANIKNNFSPKIAERIKLKRSSDESAPETAEVPTAFAELMVGDILRQCDQQNERQAIEHELRRVGTKLEHSVAQNSVLAITLCETKANCDRLALLCGKYESNAIALQLALGISDRTIEAYDVLLALLETELALDENDSDSVNNREAAESVAKQLLTHLDAHGSSDVLLSPWQQPIAETDEVWNAEHETRLREHVSRLKSERSVVENTCVILESPHIENNPPKANTQELRKMDLELAVLMQELLSLREDKADLLAKLFAMEKEKSALELKLKYCEGQHKAESAALKNLQGQLKDNEALLALATQNKELGYSDAEHAQGVEFELMQALAREARLKVRLQELVATLEQVTKNAEARLLEGREIVQDLNHTNSILADTVDRNNKKYQSKFKKMEHQMLNLVEKHTVQVQSLQQKIATLETPPTNSTDSVNSVIV